jgi:hypothetical protein
VTEHDCPDPHRHTTCPKPVSARQGSHNRFCSTRLVGREPDDTNETFKSGPRGEPPFLLGEVPRKDRPYVERPIAVESLTELRSVLVAAAEGWRDLVTAVGTESQAAATASAPARADAACCDTLGDRECRTPGRTRSRVTPR